MADVYMITCTENGKKYIGLTRRGYLKRFEQHLRDAFEGESNAVLHKAMRKHGMSSFGIDLVYQSDEVVMCGLVEQYLINSLGTLTPYGYNASKGGETAFVNEVGSCQFCNEKFDILKESDMFCSEGCRKEYFELIQSSRNKMVRRPCVECKSPFIIPRPEPEKMFCSIECETDFYEGCVSQSKRHLSLLGRLMDDDLAFRG